MTSVLRVAVPGCGRLSVLRKSPRRYAGVARPGASRAVAKSKITEVWSQSTAHCQKSLEAYDSRSFLCPAVSTATCLGGEKLHAALEAFQINWSAQRHSMLELPRAGLPTAC